jgi:hypothetical protein
VPTIISIAQERYPDFKRGRNVLTETFDDCSISMVQCSYECSHV